MQNAWKMHNGYVKSQQNSSSEILPSWRMLGDWTERKGDERNKIYIEGYI